MENYSTLPLFSLIYKKKWQKTFSGLGHKPHVSGISTAGILQSVAFITVPIVHLGKTYRGKFFTLIDFQYS